MEAAFSSVGGRNEAVSMATARVEEGTKQPDVGGSEWQAEVVISRPADRRGRYSQGGTTREQRCSELTMLWGASD